MIIDNAGTYTLRYTATDDCGKTTTVDRELVVALPPEEFRTVMYTDGTFIINESSYDMAENIAEHGEATNVYDPLDSEHDYVFTASSGRPWNDIKTSVTKVEIGSEIHPTSTQYWFNGFTNCATMDVANLHTENVTSMGLMFAGCNALTNLDVSHFDTSNVTSMDSMFSGCALLPVINVSNFNTENVTKMGQMFYNCSSLQSIDVTGFNTRNVTTMNGMFYSCSLLPSINVLNFDTSSVTTMSQMFHHCDNVTSLDLSSFNTSIVKSMSNMFANCKNLETILVSSLFTVSGVTTSSNMFQSMTNKLKGGAGTTWSSSNPLDKTYAHIDGGTSNPGYFTLKSA